MDIRGHMANTELLKVNWLNLLVSITAIKLSNSYTVCKITTTHTQMLSNIFIDNDKG